MRPIHLWQLRHFDLSSSWRYCLPPHRGGADGRLVFVTLKVEQSPVLSLPGHGSAEKTRPTSTTETRPI
jgi:hypothetical protein